MRRRAGRDGLRGAAPVQDPRDAAPYLPISPLHLPYISPTSPLHLPLLRYKIPEMLRDALDSVRQEPEAVVSLYEAAVTSKVTVLRVRVRVS